MTREKSPLSDAKTIARQFNTTCEMATDAQLQAIMESHVNADYHWRGSHPFYEQNSAQDACMNFWLPLRHSFKHLRRQEQIFFAGMNNVTKDEADIWVCSLGHLVGLFDEAWLGLKEHGKIAYLRYAEFHQIKAGKISQTALFIDIVSLLQQLGISTLPAQKGAELYFPPPAAGDGILLHENPANEADKTNAVLNGMIADLDVLNKSGNDNCPPEYLARSWHENMAWYGPGGIGSTYTIARYQQHHQYPFREGLKNKKYHGHVARIAESDYAAFFGWPNLTNSPRQGYLGLDESDVEAEMRIVDVYRRDGEKLLENWVIIDLPHYFSMLGRDIIAEAKKRGS